MSTNLSEAAQAAQESGGPGANSGRNVLQQDGNGHGVFQLDPLGSYGPWLKAHHNGLNVQENADKAASIDAGNLKVYGSTRAMLTVYNAGHNRDADTTVTTWPAGKSYATRRPSSGIFMTWKSWRVSNGND